MTPEKPSPPIITPEDVKRVAALARLQLSAEEIAQASRDLSGILAHFSLIQGINTQGIPTADDSTGLANVVRDDEVASETLASHEQLLKMAPQTQGNQIKVKTIFG